MQYSNSISLDGKIRGDVDLNDKDKSEVGAQREEIPLEDRLNGVEQLEKIEVEYITKKEVNEKRRDEILLKSKFSISLYTHKMKGKSM